jgi:hypothetical protein
MRAAGRRAGRTRWATWARARALRGLFARLDVVDLHVHRHPSRHSVERAHREAERRAARASVTPLELEERFEDLLEEWGRSA